MRRGGGLGALDVLGLGVPEAGGAAAAEAAALAPREVVHAPAQAPYVPAGALGVAEHLLEELAHLVAHPLDGAEGLLEHVSDQIRDRHAEILRGAADVLGELLRDPGVEHALLAPAVLRVVEREGVVVGGRVVLGHHVSHRNTS